MALGDLNVRIGATIKGLQAGLKSAERELKTFARQTNNLGNSLTLGLSLPLAGIGAAAVQAFANFEGLKNGLTAIAGSAQEAEAQLTRLRKIALQPSINLEQAVKASVQLQTVGFEAEEAENAISQFAKAATLSNAGAEGLAAVVKQITQINSKGRILQEDIGVLLENVPSVGIALKDAFGTTSVEAIRASGISAKEFTDRLIKAIEASETFQAAQGGLSTQIENFGIGLKESGIALGEAIAKSINLGSTLEKLTGIVNRVVDGFKSLTPEQQKAIVQIGLLVLSIGPAIKVISLLASGITALLSPINLVIVAVVALASAFIYAYNTNEQFRGGVLGSVAAIGEVITIFKEAAQALATGFKQIGEGDFSGAVKSFGEFIKKGNPIGLAVTEGERLANAYRDGFAKAASAGKLPTVNEFISNVTGGAKPGLDLSGAGGKKEKQTLEQDFFDVSAEVPIIPTLTGKGSLEGVARITDELRAQFATIPPEIIAGDQSLQGFLDRLNSDLGPAIAVAVAAVPSASIVFQELAAQFENIDQKTALFGNSADALSQKLALTKQAIENVMEDGGNTIVLELLTDQYKNLESQLSLVNEELQDMIDRGKKVSALSTLSDVFSAMSVEILRLAKAGETSFARLGNAALAAAAQVVRAKLIEAVVAYAADAFQKLGIFGVFLAGAAGAVVGAIFTKLVTSVGVPAFAQGGIVTGPTLGLVGEAGPEAIIPLRKLGSVTGMGNMELVTRVSGDDLYLIMQRANTRKNRIG